MIVSINLKCVIPVVIVLMVQMRLTVVSNSSNAHHWRCLIKVILYDKITTAIAFIFFYFVIIYKETVTIFTPYEEGENV